MKKGFTLIELLIVIAILGILAIGLMAALDPLEQLKRARDTATRNTVEEFYNACLRYYSVQEEFPWTTSAQPTVNLTTVISTYIQSLVDSGELKSRFTENTKALGRIYLTSEHADFLTNMDDIAVCFAPESKAVRGDDNSAFDAGGNTSGVTGCPTTDFSSETCYWCAR
mgnify:CR=1 FL=1